MSAVLEPRSKNTNSEEPLFPRDKTIFGFEDALLFTVLLLAKNKPDQYQDVLNLLDRSIANTHKQHKLIDCVKHIDDKELAELDQLEEVYILMLGDIGLYEMSCKDPSKLDNKHIELSYSSNGYLANEMSRVVTWKNKKGIFSSGSAYAATLVHLNNLLIKHAGYGPRDLSWLQGGHYHQKLKKRDDGTFVADDVSANCYLDVDVYFSVSPEERMAFLFAVLTQHFVKQSTSGHNTVPYHTNALFLASVLNLCLHHTKANMVNEIGFRMQLRLALMALDEFDAKQAVIDLLAPTDAILSAEANGNDAAAAAEVKDNHKQEEEELVGAELDVEAITTDCQRRCAESDFRADQVVALFLTLDSCRAPLYDAAVQHRASHLKLESKRPEVDIKSLVANKTNDAQIQGIAIGILTALQNTKPSQVDAVYFALHSKKDDLLSDVQQRQAAKAERKRLAEAEQRRHRETEAEEAEKKRLAEEACDEAEKNECQRLVAAATVTESQQEQPKLTHDCETKASDKRVRSTSLPDKKKTVTQRVVKIAPPGTHPIPPRIQEQADAVAKECETPENYIRRRNTGPSAVSSFLKKAVDKTAELGAIAMTEAAQVARKAKLKVDEFTAELEAQQAVAKALAEQKEIARRTKSLNQAQEAKNAIEKKQELEPKPSQQSSELSSSQQFQPTTTLPDGYRRMSFSGRSHAEDVQVGKRSRANSWTSNRLLAHTGKTNLDGVPTPPRTPKPLVSSRGVGPT